MPQSAVNFQDILDYRFNDLGLLETARTHRSWINEKRTSPKKATGEHNEIFEFIGDSVLGLVIANELHRRHPESDEGGLTLMKHLLVSTATLVKIAERHDFGSFIKVGRGEERTGGRRKAALLANMLEAVIAAVYFDGGFDAAYKFVVELFADELADATPQTSLDQKTTLQERLQAEKRPAPTYELVRTEGMPHDRTFYVIAKWDNGSIDGSGPSIKAAEMNAAGKALAMIGEISPPKDANAV